MLTETQRGSSDSVVMLGGHLDGVLGGPGINDNGSGVGHAAHHRHRAGQR